MLGVKPKGRCICRIEVGAKDLGESLGYKSRLVSLEVSRCIVFLDEHPAISDRLPADW